jgi:hypothetical protein
MLRQVLKIPETLRTTNHVAQREEIIQHVCWRQCYSWVRQTWWIRCRVRTVPSTCLVFVITGAYHCLLCLVCQTVRVTFMIRKENTKKKHLYQAHRNVALHNTWFRIIATLFLGCCHGRGRQGHARHQPPFTLDFFFGKQYVLGRNNSLYSIDTTRTAEKTMRSIILLIVFVAAVTFSPSRCVATIVEYTYRHTDWWEGVMKYAVDTVSVAMIYVSGFVKISSCILMLN